MRSNRSMRSSDGFSLVEVLVASFFMLILLLGILPVFHRSTVTNQMAYDNTRAAAFARSEMENYINSPFLDPTGIPVMNLPSGQTKLETEEYFDPVSHTWKVGPAPSGVSAPWSRKITIQQFHISAIDEDGLEDATALSGDADVANVHLKQVLIEIQKGNESSILGPPRTITLNTIRSN